VPHRRAAIVLVLVAAALTLALSGCSTDTGPGAAEADPGPGSVWVANEGDSTLTVLDAATGEHVATLTGVTAPHNVQAGTADQGVVWVTGTGGVVAVDAADLTLRSAVYAGEHPAHVVGTSTGSILVTGAGDGVLREFMHPDLSPRSATRVGGGPHGVRVSADGTLAAVANTDAGTVTLLGLTADRAVRTVEVGPGPVQVAVSDDASTVYASVSGTRQVVRIDTTSAAVTGRVDVPSAPAQVWLTDTGTLLSADQGSEDAPGSTLSVIDTATFTIVDTVTVGAGPHGITVDPTTGQAWVTNVYDDTVSVVDLAAGAVTGTYPVGDAPNGITFAPGSPGPAVGHQVVLPVPDTGADTHGDHDTAHTH
jgi:YVTN family beta-propeller protein